MNINMINDALLTILTLLLKYCIEVVITWFDDQTRAIYTFINVQVSRSKTLEIYQVKSLIEQIPSDFSHKISQSKDKCERASITQSQNCEH